MPSVSDTRADATGPHGPATGAATALLLATAPAADGGPAALLPWREGTLVGRLAGQLAALGVAHVDAICRPGADAAIAAALRGAAASSAVHVSGGPGEDLRIAGRLAADATGPLIVAGGDVAAHDEALARLLGDPRVATGVLAGEAPAPAHPLRAARGRVLSAGSARHDVTGPTASFLGVLRVSERDLGTLAAAAERLAPLADGDDDDVAALLLVGLVRSGAAVAVADRRTLPWARPRSEADAERAARADAAADAERDRLDAAVKTRDGFFTTFFVSPYSKHLARWAARRGLTPNQVTAASLAIGALAAAGFATGERWGLVAGAILLQLAFTADCVDGQLARYTRTFSAFGAWLDAVFDRAKEYLAFAGLAIGAARTGDPVWLLAACALALQTVRHMGDLADLAIADERRESAPPPPPVEEPADGLAPGRRAPRGSLAGRALAHRQALDRAATLLWVRKVLAFPIGERFAVISLTAALATPRTTFVALLAWGGVAAAYTTSGRLLRSVAG